MTDPIDKAIEQAENAVQMMTVQLNLGSGRPMVVALPVDFTDVEGLQAVFGLLQAMDKIKSQRPSSRLVAVNGGTLRPVS